MNSSVTGALAVELSLHLPTQWVAPPYYPMVETRGPLGGSHLGAAPVPDAQRERVRGTSTMGGDAQRQPQSPLLRDPPGVE